MRVPGLFSCTGNFKLVKYSFTHSFILSTSTGQVPIMCCSRGGGTVGKKSDKMPALLEFAFL